MRTSLILAATAVLLVTSPAQQVLGNNKGKVRATNALADISMTENPLQWSRRDFQDSTNSESFGFWPAYTIQNNTFDPDFGQGDDTGDVTITTVQSLIDAGWPASFTIPRYLFRQGGAYTNNSLVGDHNPVGTVWIKYELDDSNPSGWNVRKIQVFAWDVRDVIHKSIATKTRSFSDTAAPYRIDVYVASADSNPAASPAGNPEWTFVGTLSVANGTIPLVCQWDASTNNTFGECPQAFIDFISGNNSAGVAFHQNPTHDIWYSTLNVSGQSGIRYVALVIPQGNQYGQDPNLNASNRTSSSLRYTNFTDVRVFAGVEGDVDGNGCVDDADLLAVLFAFGCSSSCGAEDVNGDGTVDDADLLAVLFAFGQGC
ncbi:hypothetical protein HRbin15_00365 [bacterium HR15]|nr:hypothetical protein HRbin15_00365 [bacterium HR15]